LLSSLSHQLFNISSIKEFNKIALEVFNFQYKNISIYRDYVNLNNISVKDINHYTKIPFLPVEFFKTHDVVKDLQKVEKTFLSSGTTKNKRSKHHVSNLNIYKQSFLKAFTNNYGDPKDWIILGLLPSYIEQGDSSLIYMVDQLMNLSQNKHSKYIDLNWEESSIIFNELKEQKVMLFGVSYALLDLAEQKLPSLNNWTIIETGGMKGRKKEITRSELHQTLKTAFDVNEIHSEYGMSELLSQAYAQNGGLFSSPKWMKIIIRDLADPFQIIDNNLTGGINIIDLANLFSCSFIETQDIGKKYENEKFEVLGRTDNSEIRGCNLLTI
tara:strand:+ start:3394 stop:4374 length:981 start_codon:yes stop_codon:yes gene_type:complete